MATVFFLLKLIYTFFSGRGLCIHCQVDRVKNKGNIKKFMEIHQRHMALVNFSCSKCGMKFHWSHTSRATPHKGIANW